MLSSSICLIAKSNYNKCYFSLVGWFFLTSDRPTECSDSCNGHSFRIGAAAAAHEARLEDHLIQNLGRWSSDCYTRYIYTSPKVIQQAQKQLAETDHSIA
jgi:hypothetical protein